MPRRVRTLVIDLKTALQGADRADLDALPRSTFLHHQEATGVLDRKMGNVEKTGAGIRATECPACMMHLSYGARRKGLPVQVRHVSQILDQEYAAADKTR